MIAAENPPATATVGMPGDPAEEAQAKGDGLDAPLGETAGDMQGNPEDVVGVAAGKGLYPVKPVVQDGLAQVPHVERVAKEAPEEARHAAAVGLEAGGYGDGAGDSVALDGLQEPDNGLAVAIKESNGQALVIAGDGDC